MSTPSWYVWVRQHPAHPYRCPERAPTRATAVARAAGWARRGFLALGVGRLGGRGAGRLDQPGGDEGLHGLLRGRRAAISDRSSTLHHLLGRPPPSWPAPGSIVREPGRPRLPRRG